jgi:hypothetical protein
MPDQPDHLPAERQLDFWLGEWDVTWDEGGRGSNRVERILDGKVILENFDGGPSLPFRGMSVSVYNTRLEEWQQTWVDSEGNYWHFKGGFRDGQMVLATEDVIDGRPVSLRMVFSDIRSDELEWSWERSSDGGITWEVRWHLRYRRKT